jgi:Mrp family chromosome partitioning ATPase
VLRHRLIERGDDDVRVILVTSSDAEEGKTTCALNLALALSESGRAKVLLLDAHFRRPAVSRVLGLMEFCAPELWVAIEQVTPFLHVALDSQPASFDGGRIASRLEQLAADDYDFIVIDGPPILGSADVNLIQDSVSGVVLTTWSHRSHATKLREAVGQIGSGKLFGMVLLGT